MPQWLSLGAGVRLFIDASAIRDAANYDATNLSPLPQFPSHRVDDGPNALTVLPLIRPMRDGLGLCSTRHT